MAVTIKAVAEKCGLAVSTVSKAFNNYGDISDATRDLVHRTAREMGYYPNAIARTLKTNRSYNLGVLFSDDAHSGLTHSFFAQVLNAFKNESEKSGFDITFISHNIAWNGMTYLEHCRHRNVDGVCIVCADFLSGEVMELASSSLPCVTIDHAFNNRSCVMSENIVGMQLLVKHAASLGHRKIAYVHGQPSAVTEKRITGYYRGMKDQGIVPCQEYLVESLYDSPDDGYQAMMRLMKLPTPPTCVLMPDDQSCLGALKATNDLGLQVPRDVSVAGFDGSSLGQVLHPRLTSIRQDAEQIGIQAARALIEQIRSPHVAVGETAAIPVKLIVGNSTGPVKVRPTLVHKRCEVSV